MTLEHFQMAYLLISALVFVAAVCTSERTYGRAVVGGINWEMAFIMMVFWPVFLAVLLIVGVKILTERRT